METLVTQLKALADPTRLKLVRILAEGEFCVCELVEVLGCSQPSVSQHLAKLKAAGIVKERRQGQWTYYRFVSDLAETLTERMTTLLSQPLESVPGMEAEVRRLAVLDRVNCCS